MQQTNEIQFTSIPVTLGTETQWRSVYFLPINELKKGEVLQIYSEGQVQNDLNYNVELAQAIEFRTSVSGGKEPLNNSPYTSPINGWDFDSKIHYGRFSKSDSWVVDQDYEVLYLVMRLRFRSTNAHAGDQIKVNSNQGLMYYFRFTSN